MSEYERLKQKYDKMKPNTIDNWIPLQDRWDDIQTLLTEIQKLVGAIKQYKVHSNDFKDDIAFQKVLEEVNK